MEILKVFILSISSYIVLFISSKIMGNRQMSQLTMFDYIVGISIGSIAAEMATSLEDNFLEPLVAMIVYAFITYIISIITNKSLKSRRFIIGKSTILFDNDKFYRENFVSKNIDINEFLMQCRIDGYFNLADIQTAILESNGKISILPKSNKRPVTPNDLNLRISKETILTNVILDGYVLKENLHDSGHDINRLNKELDKQHIKNISDIYLAICDNTNNLTVYMKSSNKNKKDKFQ